MPKDLPAAIALVQPNRHLTITKQRRLHLVEGPRIRQVRSSANPLFESAAEVFATAYASSMPVSAIATGAVERAVTADELAKEIMAFVAGRPRAA